MKAYTIPVSWNFGIAIYRSIFSIAHPYVQQLTVQVRWRHLRHYTRVQLRHKDSRTGEYKEWPSLLNPIVSTGLGFLDVITLNDQLFNCSLPFLFCPVPAQWHLNHFYILCFTPTLTPLMDDEPWCLLSKETWKWKRHGQDFLIGTTPVLTSVLLIQWIHGCCSDTVVFPRHGLRLPVHRHPVTLSDDMLTAHESWPHQHKRLAKCDKTMIITKHWCCLTALWLRWVYIQCD